MKKAIINGIFLSSVMLTAMVSMDSCAAESNLQDILGTASTAPAFLEYHAVSSSQVDFRFSLPVRVVSLSFDPPREAHAAGAGEVVQVIFPGGLEAGEKITADLLVEDMGRNTLNLLVPFRARNDRMPDLNINELRTEYSKPKVEFVELYIKEDGNLGALRLFITGQDEPAYEFAPVEVKAGEYVVIHLRSLDTEVGLADETGDDLALSKGTDAHPAARDFWRPGSEKVLHKYDFVWLSDQDDNIIDAVALSETANEWWTRDSVSAAAELFGEKEAWFSPQGEGGDGYIPAPSDAVLTQYATATRTICRDENVEDSNRQSDWYIADTSNATPGARNSTKRYVPKETAD